MKEKLQSELAQLLEKQNKARRDEVFGGLSPAERVEYNARAERIHVLEKGIQASSAKLRRQWNKTPGTDTPRSEAHQPYRSREKESTNAFTDSLRTKWKNDSDEQGRE